MAYRRRRFSRRRRKISVAKVKYQRPTASNQKRQILSNKLQLNRLSAIVKSNMVYTDWMLTNNYTVPDGSWFVQPLSNPGDWTSALRSSTAVNNSQSTFMQSARLYFAAYSSGVGASHVNVFIVSPASESADRNPFVSGPTIYTEYVGSHDGSQCITLNPDVYKVHHHKSVLLTTCNPETGIPATLPVMFPGDPRTTYSKWFTGYKTRHKITSPTGLMDSGGVYQPQNWRSVQIEQLPYSQRMYFLIHVATQNTGGVEFYWHQHVVCKNSD